MTYPSSIRFTSGKYKGMTLDEIASTDEGLLFLDACIDNLSKTSPLHKAVAEYLSDPAISRELESILDEQETDD